jgi:hypothetical protein
MAKHKGKAKRAGTIGNKVKQPKENPFEVRVNKRRHDILGRKIKHEKGNPGVSRSRGLRKVSIASKPGVWIVDCKCISVFVTIYWELKDDKTGHVGAKLI